MTRVLLAFDETEQSVHAGEVARRLFGDGAEYLVVNVAETPVAWTAAGGWGAVWPLAAPLPPSTAEDLVDADDALRREAHDSAATTARRAGVSPAEVVDAAGDPVEAILQAAADHDVDVVVVGSHGRGWWSRVVSGSVSEALVRQAHLPVLVVKEHPPTT